MNTSKKGLKLLQKARILKVKNSKSREGEEARRRVGKKARRREGERARIISIFT